ISSFFPILINTMFGVRNVRRTLLDSALTLGASQGDLIRKVILPAALPTIFTGLRGGMGAAWGSLVAAEMLPGSIAGLGYLISHAQSYSRTDIVMAGMIAISIIGSALDFLFRLVEEKRFKWQSLAR
ncbi:MAG TPA: ABC transporter permease subunit, partial [Firmicutes bacterium]|nr:ABC transporter permease subunit [Bacillota bacterium]